MLYKFLIYALFLPITSRFNQDMSCYQVALDQWLYQNMDLVTSMYEDRFDLHTLQKQLIEEPGNGHTERQWWKWFTKKKSESGSSSLYYVVISQFPMLVKRTKELRALTGWYVFFLIHDFTYYCFFEVS